MLMHVMCYAKWHENARCYKFGNYLYTCMWVYVWYVLCKVAWKNNGMNIMLYTLWHESKVNPCYVSSTCVWVHVWYVLLMSAYFCPHLMFNFGYLIEFVLLKIDLIGISYNWVYWAWDTKNVKNSFF